MKESKFEFGPISRGIYIALICATILVPAINYKWFLAYAAFLFFLGFGLKPFMEYSGIYDFYIHLKCLAYEKLDKNWLAKRRKEVDLQEQKKRYKNLRVKDPRLPRNW